MDYDKKMIAMADPKRQELAYRVPGAGHGAVIVETARPAIVRRGGRRTFYVSYHMAGANALCESGWNRRQVLCSLRKKIRDYYVGNCTWLSVGVIK